MKISKSNSRFHFANANGNNNVGTNPAPAAAAAIKDDMHFDLAPTAGTDTLAGKTGQNYTTADLLGIAVARGATFRADGSAVAATDVVTEVEADLKPVNAHGFNEGDDTQPVTATTSDAAYENNGSWTDIDPSGGRNDGEETTTNVPTSVDNIFVANGSIVTIHLTFQKA